MELCEKYIDDPNRDQIIAREMGWPHLLEPTSEELEEIEFEGDSADENEEDLRETFESHPLYQSAFSLTVWIDQLFDEAPIAASNPSGVRLASHVAVAGAQLAAVLAGRGREDAGST